MSTGVSADSEPEPGWLPDAAIVLSGGRGSRLGGTPKGRVRVGDIPLLDGVLDAVSAAGIQRAVVVGHPPSLERAGVVVTREDPPFAGPLAGVAAGLLALPDLPGKAWVMVLACDLPRAGEVIPLLLTGSPAEDDGAGWLESECRERTAGSWWTTPEGGSGSPGATGSARCVRRARGIDRGTRRTRGAAAACRLRTPAPA